MPKSRDRVKSKKIEPKTGTKIAAATTTLLSNLVSQDGTEDSLEMPQPLFDKYLGSMFNKKKTDQ